MALPPPPPGFLLDSSPQGYGRPIIRRNPQPTPQTPAQAEKDRLETANLREQMAERRQKQTDKQNKFRDQVTTASDDILRVVQRMDRVALDANDNGGWGETGTSGKLMRKLPISTPGYDLQRDLDLIGSNAAIESLMQMRRDSQTGAGVGNVALGELQLMKDKYGTFDPDQGHDSFMQNLAEGKHQFLEKLKRINPKAYKEYMSRAPQGVWLSGGKWGLGHPNIGRQPQPRAQGLPQGWSIEEE